MDQIVGPNLSFVEAHGDREPIRSAEQKANIEGMARVMKGCYRLSTDKECLTSLMNSDYFWS